MKFFITSLLTLLTFSFAFAETPEFALIKSIQIAGSGCEAGSANALLTSDLNYMSVLYDRFSAEIGKGTSAPDQQAIEKNCTIEVIVQIPAFWNFQFESVDYNGFVSLPNKASVAYQILTVEGYGGRGLAFQQNLLKGPKTSNFTVQVTNNSTQQTGVGGKLGQIFDKLNQLNNKVNQVSQVLNLLQCSDQTQEAKIKIKSTIGVRNILAGLIKPKLQLSIDSTDIAFKQNLKIKWSRCR